MLLLDVQMAVVAKNTNDQLKLICQLQSFLVIHALVTSSLDYRNMVYLGLPLKTAQKCQMVQNSTAHMLIGVRRTDHITPIL